MNNNSETIYEVLHDMFADNSTDNAAYRICCYANRLMRVLRRKQVARGAIAGESRRSEHQNNRKKGETK